MNKLNLNYSGQTIEAPLKLIQNTSLGIEVRFTLIVILSLITPSDMRFSDQEAQRLSGLSPDQFQWVMDTLKQKGFVQEAE